MDRIAGADIAIEVSTAGLRKPVGEIYPARELLEMCVAAGKPVSLSSDAHEPEWIGHGYDRALALLGECGVEQVCVFERRQRREVPLG
jgi:histidinol-phosphatase (PHP family)